MEGLTSPQGQKQNLQFRAHKSLLGGTQKDLWLVVREGSLTDVELALTYLKKTGGNINSRNAFGLTSLHIATWRNHIPIVRRLLAAGADPDVRDGESGWSSLHRALHFGHLAVASLLLQSGASITLEDTKSRTPVDLLSGPVSQIIGNAKCSVATEVFSWGSGANYQLGTGNTHLQKSPCKLDSLHGSFIKLISAAKFHSVAVSAQGELYTWGFGRGGRLGHPEFDIHRHGQAAVITPRQVISGLGSRRVRAIAAAKHHNVVALESGEVYTWGSNREGQLGYTSVDTQPTPRRVSALKAKIVAIAAANKHSAAVSETGEVFTWGSNKEGQLGYGTSNSGSNYTPRLVEYLKGKVFTGVAAAKYHTIVLGADGEVYTWGHRLVTPRRVVVARNLKKSGNTLMKFHRMERLHVVDIAAGMVHSMALTDDGAIFYWVSADPDLRCQQLYSFCGRKVVSISSGKFWSAAVTSTGDVYMWDGKKAQDKPPLVTRLHGVKRATAVSVGETHLLIIGSIYHPAYPSIIVKEPLKSKHEIGDELGELDEGFLFDDIESGGISCSLQKDDVGTKLVPSLKSLCEKVAAQSMVEPRNAVQLLEIADSLGADDLRKHCEEIVVRNLDYIFTVSSHALASASLDILVQLEKLLDMKSLEPWSNRRLPTPTATLPAIINSEEDDSDSEFPRTRDDPSVRTISKKVANKTSHSFLQPIDDGNHVISKQVRALRKKLQQIEVLEAKQLKGHILDNQQIAKLHTRSALENSLAKLGVPIAETKVVASTSVQNDGKGGKKLEMSRKQRKIKQKASQAEVTFGHGESEMESNIKDSLDDSLDVGFSEVSEQQGVRGPDATLVSVSQESTFCSQRKDYSDLAKGSLSVASKKKSRKGGLSMFLTGGLDEIPKGVISPPPKSDGPAWGGAKISKVSASLREIQDEQRNTKENLVAKSKDKIEELSFEDGSSSKVLLSSFLPSSPIPVVSLPTAQSCDGEKSTPPWSASGTPPLLSRPSLRDIQLQQEKWPQSLSQSPKTKTAGFSVCTGQGSPSDSSGQNRWFKPEVNSPSSIRSIQIEEKAMKDLRRFYSNVKLVTDQSQRPC